MTQDSALGYLFLAGPSPLGYLPVLVEGLVEGEGGGTVRIDPGLVVTVPSPLSFSELLTPGQAHPKNRSPGSFPQGK